MTDTQDTNQPLEKGTLDEKQAVEVSPKSETPTEEVLTKKDEENLSATPEEETQKEEVAETPVQEVTSEKNDVETASAQTENTSVSEEENTEPSEDKNTEQTKLDIDTLQKPQHFTSKEEVISFLKKISEGDCQITKQELDSVKQAFYKIHHTEQEEAKQKFVEEGGNESDFVLSNNSEEEEFKKIITIIKDKRNKYAEDIEKTKEDNYKIKLSLIDKLKALVESPENANKSYNEFKRIQQQWREIKLVPQEKINELWRSYQPYVEKFYDILKINNEFREYDFKKNLEIKNHLCEAAEKLNNEPDVISAFHQLQKLHQEFRETGPVAKELREEIWQRFKVASANINRRHQQHFEELKEQEQNNLDQKTVICEIIESIEWNTLKSFAVWEEKTQEISALQNKWKTIGFVPKKMNTKIFDRFRNDCDDFFKRKREYFKTLKEGMNANLTKKRELAKKAEELKDSTDWKTTSDTLISLQKEWKTIGPVSKKYSDSIWKQFISACDYFFEQKGKVNNSQHSVERQNLEQKKVIIEKLNAINEDLSDEEADTTVHELIKEWNNIGHVPYKEKDKIYEQFHSKVNELFNRFHISSINKGLNSYKTTVIVGNGTQMLYKEKDKLTHSYDNLKSQLQTYENNLGFLSLSSKGSSLLTEINRKVEQLKAELELIAQKLKAVNDQIKENGEEQNK